jgi:hypothetical protein
VNIDIASAIRAHTTPQLIAARTAGSAALADPFHPNETAILALFAEITDELDRRDAALFDGLPRTVSS